MVTESLMCLLLSGHLCHGYGFLSQINVLSFHVSMIVHNVGTLDLKAVVHKVVPGDPRGL